MKLIKFTSQLLKFSGRLFLIVFKPLHFIVYTAFPADKNSKTYLAKKYIDKRGYYRFSTTHKLVHRWVAETKLLRRKLNDEEVVHHKNRNKLDNRPENLQVFPNQKAHEELHKRDAEKYGWDYSYLGNKK